MLQHLYINNYAIIDELSIDFSDGMNIITGETGAGKSIIIGALNLILGTRADSTVLVNKTRKCIIEGVFSTSGKDNVTSFLATNDLDLQNEVTVRREIAVNGKSRAFINDSPVNLAQLQELSAMLVDLHQQFDSLALGEDDFQRNVLDTLAGNQPLLGDYTKIFSDWQQAAKKLAQAKELQLQFEKETDYNQFQYDELANAAFRENEIEAIDAELKMMAHAEGIKSVLGRVYSELENGEQPIVQQLKSLSNLLQTYSGYHIELPSLLERMRAAQVELRDIALELDSINDQVHYHPEKIEQLNDRLSLGYKLQKKHGVQSTAALLAIQQQFEEKLQAVLQIGDDITVAEQRCEMLRQQTVAIAAQMSQSRKKQVKPLETSVNRLLAQVGMPNAALKVSISPKTAGPGGIDAIDFLFDANKSGQFKPVNKIASGGELSRLMLCIKSLVAEKMDMPTLIFDEIDSGISGEAAKQVGIIMKDLAASRQVICITHQPQIAGKANAHFFVYKEMKEGILQTNIRLLNNQERITTIAQMLSGEKPTAAALQNAREMVEH